MMEFRLKVGDVFVSMPVDDVREKVEQDQEQIKAELLKDE